MTNKEKVFEIIGGNQFHNLWNFLTRNWWEPELSVWEWETYLEAFSSPSTWYSFNDPSRDDDWELSYNWSASFDNQDAATYELLLKFLQQV